PRVLHRTASGARQAPRAGEALPLQEGRRADAAPAHPREEQARLRPARRRVAARPPGPARARARRALLGPGPRPRVLQPEPRRGPARAPREGRLGPRERDLPVIDAGALARALRRRLRRARAGPSGAGPAPLRSTSDRGRPTRRSLRR